jgi:hypothetical protein
MLLCPKVTPDQKYIRNLDLFHNKDEAMSMSFQTAYSDSKRNLSGRIGVKKKL